LGSATHHTSAEREGTEQELRELRRTNRILAAKLKRANINRQRLEEHRDTTVRVHRRIISEMEATQEALRAAREAEAAASAAKSQFLANMSHELRTPLTAIIGFAELVGEEPTIAGNADLSDDVGNILDSGRHLLALIDTLLDLSKVEAGKMEMRPEAFDLAEFIGGVAAGVTPVIQRHDNRFEVECPSDFGIVYADRTRLRQVLTNLLANAARFTSGGVVRLAVEDHGHHVAFQVADTGCGMNACELDQIFEPFNQGRGPRSGQAGGTGLGLTIARQFVRMMNGTVSVSSQPGKGSTFTVRVALSRVDPAKREKYRAMNCASDQPS